MSKDKEMTPVRTKLAAHKDANSGHYDETLPQSGVKVQIPKFINHGAWMLAQRQAKGDMPKAQAAFVVGVVAFEGEKLTYADVQSGLIDTKDMMFLMNEIFEDEDLKGDDAGNDQTAG